MTEAKSRYIEYRPDEYIAGVAAKLTFEEQGMYWMICSLIMSNGGAIENDIKHIAGLGRMTRTKANNLLEKLIEKGKITENDGILHQKRSENEVILSLKRIENARKNGAKGGRPSNKNKDLEKAKVISSANLTNNENQEPITSKEKTYKKENRFDEFWILFPRQRRGNKEKAEHAYNRALKEKRATEDKIIAGVKNYGESEEVANGYGKGAAAWINDDRWSTDYSITGGGNGSGQNSVSGKSGDTGFGQSASEIGARMDARKSEQQPEDWVHGEGEQRTDLSDDGPFIEHDDPGNWG